MPTTTQESTGARPVLAPPAHTAPAAPTTTGAAGTTPASALHHANQGVREKGETLDPFAEYVVAIFKGSLAAIGVVLLHTATSFVIDKVAAVGVVSASAPLTFLHHSLDLLGAVGAVGGFAVLVVADGIRLVQRALRPRRAQ
jgi:hypothetical protein